MPRRGFPGLRFGRSIDQARAHQSLDRRRPAVLRGFVEYSSYLEWSGYCALLYQLQVWSCLTKPQYAYRAGRLAVAPRLLLAMHVDVELTLASGGKSKVQTLRFVDAISK